MKALLIRDILYLRSQWRRLLSVPAAWLAAMALLPAHRGLLAAAAALFAALLPLCTLDACPGFERYAALLPVSRSALAVSRHVLGALSSAAALAAVLASALLLGWPPWVVYRPALIGLYLGCTLLSLALPLACVLGAGLTRAFAAALSLSLLLALGGASLDWTKSPEAALIAGSAALASMCVSAIISVRTCAAREF